MMEYRFHAAALDAFREQLALSNFPDANVAALRDQHVADADEEPGAALLGAFISLLVWHAASNGRELDLLDRAAQLWQAGLALHGALSQFRRQIEAVLADPNDAAALAGLNAATRAIQPLVQKVVAQDIAIKALRAEVVTLAHLKPHPRQEDVSLADWDWGDIFVARQTETFIRAVRRLSGDAKTSAFALGVMSSYGADAAGSAFLGQAVGGPRRSHRLRHRIGRNTIGAWIGTDPFAPQLRDLSRQLSEAFPNGLPDAIEGLIRTAVEKCYAPGAVPPMPDLKLGFERLIRHLDLLAKFEFPEEPSTPQEQIVTRLFGDPATPYVPSIPEGTGLLESGAPPGVGGSNPGSILPQNHGNGALADDGPSHSEPPDSTEVKCGAFWEALGWSFLFLIGGWIACVIRWQDGDRCQLWDDITQNWERAFPNGAHASAELSGGQAQPLTANGAANLAQSDQVLQLVGDLHNLHMQLWEGFHKAQDFLALYGLIYPNGLTGKWRYRQYLAAPLFGEFGWPHLPDPGPRFDEYPASEIEQPAVFQHGYQPGATVEQVLSRVPQAGVLSAADLGLTVWMQLATGVEDSSNLDLDADRGWKHPCWRTGGSIADQPIDVIVLGYNET